MKKVIATAPGVQALEIEMDQNEKEAFEAEWLENAGKKNAVQYREARRLEYLPLGDVADALFKQRQHLVQGLEAARQAGDAAAAVAALIDALQPQAELQDVDARTLAVKAANPKPVQE